MPFWISIQLDVKSTISRGRCRFLILWASLSVTVFGKAPSISRNRIEVILPLRQAFLTITSRVWRESVVVHPGHPPKWWTSNKLWLSRMNDTWSAMIEVSSLLVVLMSAMGQYTFGTVGVISFSWFSQYYCGKLSPGVIIGFELETCVEEVKEVWCEYFWSSFEDYVANSVRSWGFVCASVWNCSFDLFLSYWLERHDGVWVNKVLRDGTWRGRRREEGVS